MRVDGKAYQVSDDAPVGYSVKAGGKPAPGVGAPDAADERPRGHRRHRHGGPVGDHPRPQRPLALRAAARARRRARAHRRRRRPPGRRARRARVPRRRGRRPDPHHRRARADRGRPHRRGRGRVRGPEMVLDPALEERILAILRRNRARWRSYSEEAMRAGQPQAGGVPRGATILEPVGTAPGLVVDRGDGRPLVVVLPGPPGELRRCGPRRSQTPPLQRAAGPRGHVRAADAAALGVPESEIAQSLLAIEARRRAARPARDHDLPAPRRDRDRHRLRARRRAGDYDAFVDGIRARHGDTLFSEDGATIDAQVARAARAGARSRSPSRAPAG